MFENLKLLARVAAPLANLKAIQRKLEEAYKARDFGRIADLIDSAIPEAEKLRDEFRSHAAKYK